MSALQQHEEQSPLFHLPAETRLSIYSHLIPKDGIYIDLCTPRKIEGAEFTVRKRSVVSTLMLQMFAIDAVSRGNGLHLLVSLVFFLVYVAIWKEDGSLGYVTLDGIPREKQIESKTSSCAHGYSVVEPLLI